MRPFEASCPTTRGKRGGLITSVVAVLVCPWYIYSSSVAVDYFLGGVGALLGPLFGVMMVDFFRVRKSTVQIEDLYIEGPESSYWYSGGWNQKAVAAFAIGAAVAVPIALLHTFSTAAPFAWFIGTAAAGIVYLAISPTPAEAATTKVVAGTAA